MVCVVTSQIGYVVSLLAKQVHLRPSTMPVPCFVYISRAVYTQTLRVMGFGCIREGEEKSTARWGKQEERGRGEGGGEAALCSMPAFLHEHCIGRLLCTCMCISITPTPCTSTPGYVQDIFKTGMADWVLNSALKVYLTRSCRRFRTAVGK